MMGLCGNKTGVVCSNPRPGLIRGVQREEMDDDVYDELVTMRKW